MEAATSQSTTAAEQVARSYFEAVGARDLEAAVGNWHAEGIEDIVPLRPYRGTEGVREFLGGLFAAFPDLGVVVTRVTADERVAVVEYRMSGTFSGAPFEGIDPTGARVEFRGADAIEVEDGKVVRNTAYYDGMSFARAIGMMPPQDSGVERAMTSAFNGATKLRTLVREQIHR